MVTLRWICSLHVSRCAETSSYNLAIRTNNQNLIAVLHRRKRPCLEKPSRTRGIKYSSVGENLRPFRVCPLFYVEKMNLSVHGMKTFNSNVKRLERINLEPRSVLVFRVIYYVTKVSLDDNDNNALRIMRLFGEIEVKS